ncbi:MAG: CoA pyrophosphatase [Deltaproteobacteria bacterium]|nr:CoA pyrophosphatase [Deltaproteobacteria bacterium]MBN2672650.1 CoA pyrophosphatase [Deltaproteobacteria bacterium]
MRNNKTKPEWLNAIRSRLLSAPDRRNPSCIPAAVLVALVSKSSGIHVVFTKRTMTVTTHKGQVSLPGGATEPEDTDDVQTALREAEEEVGLAPSAITVLGFLKSIRTITDFWVTPVVGAISSPVSYRLQKEEVATVFEVPLAELLDTAQWTLERRTYNGREYDDCRFHKGEHVIWGATGKIIYSMAEKLNGLFMAGSS